jgi:serine/threonine protein kinase
LKERSPLRSLSGDGGGRNVAQAFPLMREVGAEPIPGYRLLQPLGQGGFGEVWKCEAPGGLFKAIKFVGQGEAGASLADQELAALQRVKTIRHPFLLSLDRVEVIDGTLLIIMELADRSLHALHADFRQRNEPGIPREDLLAYLLETAEALDTMNFEHGLQHLDVKPHNLFLVSNHIKVADFGLVHSLGESNGELAPRRQGGSTPLYASPEILRGTISRQSDQYSLAIVYQQLLTSTVPFWDEKVSQLVMKHLSAEPELAALPVADRPVVSRALAKRPEDRFPSCIEMVQALLDARPPRSSLRSSGMWRRVLLPVREDAKPAAPAAPSRSAAPLDGPALTPVCGPSAAGELTRPLPVEVPAHDQPEADTRCESATVRDVVAAPSSGEPTSVSLPGYRFVQCLAQSPLGDLWRAHDATGRERRALCLLNFVRYDEQLISHLRALRHLALPPTDVHWSPADRMVLVTDCYDQTLRDCFEACLATGLPGIPRTELLRYLRTAAEALDALAEQHNLHHLSLHPRNLLVQDDRLWIADFGLVPLVWLPTGQRAGPLNARYAAPELFERPDSNTADQYSLALIYAEMLTGAQPRSLRPPAGPPRRSGSRSSVMHRPQRIDLDLLPLPDREIIVRALDPLPAKRYPNCLALVEALESAGACPGRAALYVSLPPVIPFASLFGEPAAPEVVLPSARQIVAALTSPRDPREVRAARNIRYRAHPDGSCEYCCPIQLLPGPTRLKVDGFRQHWNARLVKEEQGTFVFQIDLQAPRRFWERVLSQPRRVTVELRFGKFDRHRARLTEARAFLRAVSGDPEKMKRIVAELAPHIFDSLRSFLQASPEQRACIRQPFPQPLHVYPVLPDLELAEMIAGVGRNLSSGGIRFCLPKPPPTGKLYLHFHESAQADFAILAEVMRTQSNEDGGCDIGAFFPEMDSGA